MNRTVVLGFTASVLLGLSAGGALAASDKSFLAKALKGDNSEMRLGAIAEKKGASPGVREFGRMLESDHSAAKANALPVAQAHGVAPTEEMTLEAKKEVRKLARLSGPGFDREFARYMVKDHKKDISDFEKQASNGDRQTADLARQTLPALRKHLETAERLAH